MVRMRCRFDPGHRLTRDVAQPGSAPDRRAPVQIRASRTKGHESRSEAQILAPLVQLGARRPLKAEAASSILARGTDRDSGMETWQSLADCACLESRRPSRARGFKSHRLLSFSQPVPEQLSRESASLEAMVAGSILSSSA